jgi:hypothetical protein
MKPAYLGGIALLVVFAAIGVYYLIPGPTKFLVSDDPTGVHVKHALVFFALAIVSIIGARFVANSTTTAS